ncbi:hypothetical protein GCM10023321_78230 [Pseudonocardia eucalypti]|uniref:Uncharacterized protein n=1 Tax=Pseudonocardia eucalypti TaxID=648755 RepID=A0ABP9RCH6_9PSEU|nr:putative membrane protein YwzB [Pseudonocardia eucalypti]
MTMQTEMNTRVVKGFLWTGPVLVAALVVAQGLLMQFIPGPSPALSPEQLAARFMERRTEIQIGSVLQCICWSFWATWAIAVTLFIRKMERGYPILTYASIALVGGGYVFFILIPMTWAVCAFRVDTLDPSIIQVMNDWVWFDWLFTWPPFSIWMIVIALAIFNDHNVPTLYPRWVAYLNLWSAVLIFPAGLIVFFKTGLFAYDGIGAFWLPVVVFFGWICVMTVTTFQVVNKVDRQLSAGPAATPAPTAA